MRPALSRLLLTAGLLAAAHLCVPAPVRAQTPDTLDVFVLYVEFEDEGDANNEATTTGKGYFGSDKDMSYTLDPNGEQIRRSAYYLTKRFEFAQNYFDKVSGGRVVIRPRIFPPPGGDSLITPPKLDDRMKAYNPAFEDKAAKQKTSDFATQRAIELMRFVVETARAHDVANPASNPFKVAAAERATASPNKHQAFLIFHAGHSRLVDGGTLGYLGANTPNDFTDFFVTKPDFKYLGDSTNKREGLKPDSLGVVVNGGLDTVTQFMMLSESASQDKINWGINGILINQLARQMGMPDLFDVVKGISSVGSFDLMDFAGYNTMQGFLPIFPSAWPRTFMGWDDVRTARPGDAGNGSYSEYKIHAADQPGPGRTRTLKVPLNEREYLLIENRQRAGRDTAVTVWFSEPANSNDFKFTVDGSVTVPVSFLDSLFLDSLCTGTGSNPCASKTPNAKKPRGIITKASHYDMGLPGNGLLVWHVNEWFMELALPLGAVNLYLGDQYKNQYKGLELVEADGVPSIGKEFSDALGQPAFDYGTARDMLPHLYRKRKNPPKDTTWAPLDTIRVVGAQGFANTNAWNDGRTHFRIEALLPASPILAPGTSSFSGDSVFSVRDSAITVRIHWADSLTNKTVSRAPGSLWPVRTAASGNARAVSVLRDERGRAYVASAADSGSVQTYAATGRAALAARDTVRDRDFYDSVKVLLSSGNTRPDNAAPVNSFVDSVGTVIGSATSGDSLLVVLTTRGLHVARARADSLTAAWDTAAAPRLRGGNDLKLTFAGKAGPMVWGDRVYALDSAGQLLSWVLVSDDSGFGVSGGRFTTLPAAATTDWHALAGIVLTPSGGADSLHVLVAGRRGGFGVAARVSPTGISSEIPLAWGGKWLSEQGDSAETFTLSVSDFDRDAEGTEEAFLLGSRGAALLFQVREGTNAGQAFPGWPQRLPRVTLARDTLGVYLAEEPSPPALTDLNRDGYPDIVFAGANAIHAYDGRGAIVRGWPFRPQPRQIVGLAYANRLQPGGVFGASPLAVSLHGSPVILVPTPDGLIYAADNAGRALTFSSWGSLPELGKGAGALMVDKADWPLTAGGLNLDSLLPSTVHISLANLDTGAVALANAADRDLSLIAHTATGSLNVWTLRGSRPAAINWLVPGGDAGRSQRLNAAALPRTTALVREDIEEFNLYPSPLRGGIAKVHLKLGTQTVPAGGLRARVRVYDLSGRVVKDESWSLDAGGTQPVRALDLRHLGPDVYSVLCEVSFPGGKKMKWQKLGVVK